MRAISPTNPTAKKTRTVAMTTTDPTTVEGVGTEMTDQGATVAATEIAGVETETRHTVQEEVLVVVTVEIGVVVVEDVAAVEGSHSTGAWTTSIAAMGTEATTTTQMPSTNIATFKIRSLRSLKALES